MAKTSEKLETPTVLAFERKLDPSDAVFSAGNWDARDGSSNWQPVRLREKSVRGTISHRMKTKGEDPAKLDAAKENANLQTVDVAALPSDADTLKVQFTLRVLPDTGIPSACNNPAYRAKLIKTVQGYVQNPGFSELARRYAFNLANGRFLWRNRLGAEQIHIQVAQLRNGAPVQAWELDALSLPLRTFDADGEAAGKISAVASLIEQGLSGKQHVLLQVTAFVRAGAGQEVFPSQELILNKDKGNQRGKKSKTLYSVNGTAAMHSQKIGNAIRTIDTWYPGVEENGPIASEPYGSVTTMGVAFRQPRDDQDFYSWFDGWVLKDNLPSVEQQHFVISVLIRGGVFGVDKSKKSGGGE